MKRSYPLLGYAIMIGLGLLPSVLVTYYYDHLPDRMLIHWDMMGRMTIVATRAKTVLLVANFAAVAGLAGTAVAIWQHRAFVALDGLRAFLVLNMAQIVVINLTCVMLVTESLGYHLAVKPMIPSAMALLLFSAGVLCWRIEAGDGFSSIRLFGGALAGAGIVLLALNAALSNLVVGYFAAAFSLLMMIAVLIPSQQR